MNIDTTSYLAKRVVALQAMSIDDGKKRLVEILVERSLNGKETISCRRLLQEALPQFVKDSVLSLAQKHLKTEKPIAWNFNAQLDFDDEEVKVAGERLMMALLRSVRFSRGEVEQCISNALKLRFDLLVHPRQTIERVFFKSNDRHDRKLLAHSLNKIGHGIPYVDILAKKIEQSEQTLFDREAFVLTSEQSQKELYSDSEKKGLLIEFGLIVDLFSIEKTLSDEGLGTSIVEEFLAARGFSDAVSIVRKKTSQGKAHWHQEDIKDIFTFVLKMPELQVSEAVKTAEKPIKFPKIIFSDDEEIFRVHRHNIERQPPGPYPSIFSFIDHKDKRNFVRKLFQKDESAFQDFMDRVDGIGQWREAKQVIDWELEKRHLDPYCKEAVRLGDIVFAKYFSNGKYA